MTASPDDIAVLTALEDARCRAISAGDLDTLRAMLTDDYLHVHMTGRVDDRAGHLAAVAERPRRSERGALDIRVYGDLAVLVGEQVNHGADGEGRPTATRAVCHQVAVREDGAWRVASVQLTPLRDPSPASEARP